MIWPFTRKPDKRRPARAETGRQGERAAERFLRKAGHRPLARNVTYRQGEVDLVTLEKRTGTLCFVEVRSRAVAPGRDLPIRPEETVTLRKRRRVIRAARKFLADHGLLDRPVRFDVVAVLFAGDDRRKPEVTHFPAAFDSTGR
jgi:putative endonuclease